MLTGHLAPCDCWLFGYLKQSLDGRFFDHELALQIAASEILVGIELDVFVRVFAEWKHRPQQCIDREGDYLSTTPLGVLFLKPLRILPQENGLFAPLGRSAYPPRSAQS
jgi:hypothetical protein